jgi:hypothetical protein
VAVGAQKDTLRGLSPRLLERAGNAALAERKTLLSGIAMMKLKGRDAPVVSAELASTASLGDEYPLHPAPPTTYRF